MEKDATEKIKKIKDYRLIHKLGHLLERCYNQPGMIHEWRLYYRMVRHEPKLQLPNPHGMPALVTYI